MVKEAIEYTRAAINRLAYTVDFLELGQETYGKEYKEMKESTNNNKSFYVKDCKRFLEEKMEIVLINQYKSTNGRKKLDEYEENTNGAKLIIFVRLYGNNWIQNYVDNEKWKLFEIKDTLEVNKMKKIKESYRFYIKGSSQFTLFSVDFLKQTIHFDKFLSIKGRYGYLLQYSFYKNIFFISPCNNTIKD